MSGRNLPSYLLSPDIQLQTRTLGTRTVKEYKLHTFTKVRVKNKCLSFNQIPYFTGQNISTMSSEERIK